MWIMAFTCVLTRHIATYTFVHHGFLRVEPTGVMRVTMRTIFGFSFHPNEFVSVIECL
jgi:hypothetical protein